jgi:hypothetical protein
MSETCFISLHKSSGIDCKKSGGERELPKKQETRLKVDIFFSRNSSSYTLIINTKKNEERVNIPMFRDNSTEEENGKGHESHLFGKQYRYFISQLILLIDSSFFIE